MGSTISFETRNGIGPGDKVKLTRTHGLTSENPSAPSVRELRGKQLTVRGYDERNRTVVLYKNYVFGIPLDVLEKVDDEDVVPQQGDWVQIGEVNQSESPVAQSGLIYKYVDGDNSQKVVVARKLTEGSFVDQECDLSNLKWLRKSPVELADDVLFVNSLPALKAIQSDEESALSKFLGQKGHVVGVKDGRLVEVRFKPSENDKAVDLDIDIRLLEVVNNVHGFSVGDKVRVTNQVEKLKIVQHRCVGNWNDGMKKYAGQCATITKIQIGDCLRAPVFRLTFAKKLDTVKISSKCVALFEEKFYAGEKVVCALSSTQLATLTGSEAYQDYHSERCKVVSDQIGDKVEVDLENGTRLTFPARCLLLVSSPDVEDSDDSDTEEQLAEEREQTFLYRHRGMGVGDVVTLGANRKTFDRIQQSKGGDCTDDIFDTLSSSLFVVKGATTKGMVVIAKQGEMGQFKHWKISAKLLEKREQVQLFVGDTIVMKTAADAGGDGIKGIVVRIGQDTCTVLKHSDSTVEDLPMHSDCFRRVLPDALAEGDDVQLLSNGDIASQLQTAWSLEVPEQLPSLLGTVGYVTKIHPVGHVFVKIGDGTSEYLFNAALLTKTHEYPKLKVGDKVKLIDDIERVKSNQTNHGNWIEGMMEARYKVGVVCKVIAVRDDDVRVHFVKSSKQVCSFVLNRRSLTEYTEEFNKGDNVICALTYDELANALPTDHKMVGLEHLKWKKLVSGKVRRVTGEGKEAYVKVKYADGVEMEYMARHILLVPGEDVSMSSANSPLDISDALLSPFMAQMGGMGGLLGPMAELHRTMAGQLNRWESSSSSSSSSSDDDDTEVKGAMGGQNVASFSGNSNTATSAMTSVSSNDAAGIPEVSLMRSLSGGASNKTVYCCLCYNSESLVSIKCGHILCKVCADKLLDDKNLATYRKCPMDRKKFKKYTKLFL